MVYAAEQAERDWVRLYPALVCVCVRFFFEDMVYNVPSKKKKNPQKKWAVAPNR